MKAAFVCRDKALIDQVYSDFAKAELKNLFEFYDGVYKMDSLEEIKDVECIFSTWGMITPDEEEIKEKLPNLKMVFYGAGSVQFFARPFLNLGIPVISAWMANSVPVIEYTVAQILLANKGFFLCTRRNRSRSGRDESRKYFGSFPGNYGTKVGIIGLGAIGSGVAESLKAYNLEVYAHDPFASEEKAEKLGVKLVSLEKMFSECQVISNHVANLPETENMLSGKLFDLMKDNAVFINTGRGKQVVEADLVKALSEKPDRCAVLDVSFPEPPEEDSPLYTMENVFLTPHIAGSAGEECKRMGQYMVEEATRFLKGEPLKYEVTLKMLETMA